MKTDFGNLNIRFNCAVYAMSLALIALGCTVAASAQKLCFPQVTGLPVKSGSSWTFPNTPPQIPGTSCTSACPLQPAADTGWFNAFRYTLQTGTDEGSTPADGVFQAILQGSLLYFDFEINNVAAADEPSASDAVVVIFDNQGPSQSPPKPQKYTWLWISGAFKSTTSPSNPQAVPSGQLHYYTSADGSNWSGQLFPSWVHAGMAGGAAGSNYSWWVVLSVDNSDPSGPQLPSSGQFNIYATAIRADFDTVQDNQNAFPGGSVLQSVNATTLPATFANAFLSGGSCTGVFITSSDITNTIGGSPTDLISLSKNPNTFQVTIHNSGAAVAGPPGTGVSGTFKIANFGLPAPDEWLPIGTNICALSSPPMPDCTGASGSPAIDPVTNNPTTPTTITAAVTTPTGSCNDGTGNQCVTVKAGPPGWSLGGDNQIYYNFDDHQHECVRVDLDSNLANTAFTNNSAWNNFEFSASASQFSGPATVSARYPAVGANGLQTFQLRVLKQPLAPAYAQSALARVGRKPAAAGEGNANYLKFTVNGCRVTGKTLTEPVLNADGRPTGKTVTFQNCDSVGSYGYLIRHDGPVQNWNYVLSASGTGVSMTPLKNDPDSYSLIIPQGQKAQVVSAVTPNSGGGGGGGLCSKGSGGAVFVFPLGAVLVGAGLYWPRRRKQRRQAEDQ